MAAAPNGGWCEFPYDPPGWVVEARDFMLTEPFRIDAAGDVVLPDRPGLGVELDWDRIAAHGQQI
jgi:L-alanine-DL-glutamate epimerase-like enolase superfamily enzyme